MNELKSKNKDWHITFVGGAILILSFLLAVWLVFIRGEKVPDTVEQPETSTGEPAVDEYGHSQEEFDYIQENSTITYPSRSEEQQ